MDKTLSIFLHGCLAGSRHFDLTFLSISLIVMVVSERIQLDASLFFMYRPDLSLQKSELRDSPRFFYTSHVPDLWSQEGW